MMLPGYLIVLPLAVGVVALTRSEPRTLYEGQVYGIIDRALNITEAFNARVGPGWRDQWHDNAGLPNSTHDQIVEFFDTILHELDRAGSDIAAISTNIDSTTSNWDYLRLIDALFPYENLLPGFWRFTTPEAAALGVTEQEAKELASRYDDAWYGAVLAVETAVPSVTRDYVISSPFFWTPAELRDWYPRLADYIATIPWTPSITFCSQYWEACSNLVAVREPGVCYATADELGLYATFFLGVWNDKLGFDWECQIYTDSACGSPLFIPAQPCEYCLEPPIDWDGKFGGAGNPKEVSGYHDNPAAADSSLLIANSIKCV